MQEHATTAAASESQSCTSRQSVDGKYTAVVYFHGMGSQKRYEEVSRLVDCLDQHAQPPRADDAEKTGKLRNICAFIEPNRVDGKGDVSYVKLLHHHTVNHSRCRDDYRFYEAYWAPVAAGGVPEWGVLKWMFQQMPNPIRSLMAPWRTRARLRMSYLYTHWSELNRAKNNPYKKNDLKHLAEAYRDFEGPDAWRAYPKGNFAEFIDYLQRPDGENASCVALARSWLKDYRLRECFNLFVLTTLGLTLVLGGLALLGVSYNLLRYASTALTGMNAVSESWKIGEQLAPNWEHTLALALVAAGLLPITGFLREYMGDVQLWATYQETEEKNAKRREILQISVDTLRHVLLDQQCTRIVVIAHSLGTTVAHDTLLQLGRYNRARPEKDRLPLDKLDQFVTLASPIDKIHYFFESEPGNYHRYNRVKEEVRGDISGAPFTVKGKPRMHWINFWDQADIIGGSLESPNALGRQSISVDNIEVANFRFPEPASSHSAYFQHPGVVGRLFDILFNKYGSFWPTPDANADVNYTALLQGPGVGLASTKIFQAIMLTLPWLILAYALTNLLWAPSLISTCLGWLAAGVAGFLAVSYWRGRHQLLTILIDPAQVSVETNADK
jgi:hypothetical protein